MDALDSLAEFACLPSSSSPPPASTNTTHNQTAPRQGRWVLGHPQLDPIATPVKIRYTRNDVVSADRSSSASTPGGPQLALYPDLNSVFRPHNVFEGCRFDTNTQECFPQYLDRNSESMARAQPALDRRHTEARTSFPLERCMQEGTGTYILDQNARHLYAMEEARSFAYHDGPPTARICDVRRCACHAHASIPINTMKHSIPNQDGSWYDENDNQWMMIGMNGGQVRIGEQQRCLC
jgi:hypothetical protein